MFQMATSFFMKAMVSSSPLARTPSLMPGTPYDLEMLFITKRCGLALRMAWSIIVESSSSAKSTNDSSITRRMPFSRLQSTSLRMPALGM